MPGAAALEHLPAGRLKVLATTGASRLPILPNVPTVAESLPGFEALNWFILAVRGESVAAIMQQHWARFGRNYYARHDYEAIESDAANALIGELSAALPALPGRSYDALVVAGADSFAYTDPVDHSISNNQGLRVWFEGGSRVVFRLSGTGTEGATLRVYLEAYEPAGGRLDLATPDALAELVAAAEAIAGIARHTGRTAPDVVT